MIVVGGGLAGGMAALTVAQAGHPVGIIECGPLQPQDREPLRPNAAQDQNEARWTQLPPSGKVAGPAADATRRDRSPRPMPAMLGIGPGGSSAIYAAALSRYRRSDFLPRAVAGALPREWPFEYDELIPFMPARSSCSGLLGRGTRSTPTMMPSCGCLHRLARATRR